MSRLSPVAFDIETSGVGPSAVITVAGFAHEMGEYLIVNHAGRGDPDSVRLSDQLAQHSAGELELFDTACIHASVPTLRQIFA